MKSTSYTMGLAYLAMGVLFTFLAIETSKESIWNVTTFFLMMIATFDFIASIRFFTYKKKD